MADTTPPSTTGSASPLTALSVTIVCCNNEATIGRTLASIDGLAGEVVAVDSGSTDGTLAMLEDAGVTVVHQPWLGYVKQKQFAMDRCTGEWVLHLDSDESVDDAMRASIRSVVEANDPAVSAGTGNRMTVYAGRFLRHTWQPEWRLRLARRDRARWDGIDPHDFLAVDRGETVRLAGTMRHDAIPDIATFLARQVSHARVSATALHARGARSNPIRMATSPISTWLKQVVLRRGFLDGWRGLVCASAAAAGTLMKHAILIELERTRARSDGGGQG